MHGYELEACGSRRRRGTVSRHRLLAGCAVVAALGAAEGALAQDTQPETSDDAEVLTVTGTRIQRSGFTAPTPVTVTTRDEIDALGLTNVGDVIAQLPMNNPEVSSTSTSQGSLNGYASDANIGAELANLRGLNLAAGTRTLTLVDGHRFVPSTNGGAVDLGLIPSNLVLRTEVVTGGASAAYGSDAVAGVVNVVLNHDLEGIQGQFDFGETFRGDGEEFHFGLAGGASLFNDRGHLIVGVEYEDARGVGQCTATRDWCLPYAIMEAEGATAATSAQFNLVNNAVGTATLPGSIIQVATGPTFATPAATSPLANYANLPAGLRNKQFSQTGGDLVDWRTGAFLDDAARLMAGGEGVAPDDDVLLRVPVQKEAFYSRFSYDLTNNLTGYVEASFGSRDADNSQATLGNSWIGTGNAGLLIKGDNAFLSDDTMMAIADAGATGVYVNKPLSAFPQDYQPFSTTSNETTRFVAGLDGEFADGWLSERNWSYDGYYTYGVNEQSQRLNNLPRRTLTASNVTGLDADGIRFGITGGEFADGSYPDIVGDPEGIYGVSNFDLAVDAVVDPMDGQVKCRINSSLRTPEQTDILNSAGAVAAGVPDLVQGCLPLNVLGVGNMDPAALDWAFGTQTEDYEYTQHVIGGNAQGEVFDIWTGPVVLAGGFEYRDESGETIHTAPTEYWSPNYGGDFLGGQKIVEGYLETDFALLRDVPFARELNINAAVRRTKAEVTDETPLSDTFGETREFEFTTWKVSGVWDVTEQVRFRATRSRDVRAPSFRDLFFPGRPTPNWTLGVTNPWYTEQELGLTRDEVLALPSNQWLADPEGADLPRNGGGNPNLTPEIADTTTVGVVFQPGGWADGLRLSLDGYQIDLENGIANVYTNGVITNCYILGTPSICNRIISEFDGEDATTTGVTDYDAIVTGSNNVSNFTVKGVDFEVSYTTDLDRFADFLEGELTLRGLTSYMDELLVEGDLRGTLFGNTLLLAFAGTDYAGQVGAGGVDDVASFSESPTWQGTYSASYANGPFRTTLQAKWVGEAKLYNDLIDPSDPAWALGSRNTLNVANEVGSYLNWTLSGSYNFGEDSDGGRDVEIFGVINNLFDRAPEIAPPLTTGVSTSGGGSSITNPVFYDTLGRRYRVGVRFRF